MLRFLIVVVAAVAVVAAAPAETVTDIFVITRHGARTTFVLTPDGPYCDPPYCQVTPEGLRMGRAVGEGLRDHILSRGGAAPAALPKLTSCRATQSERVRRTIVHALRGLYQEPEEAADYAWNCSDPRNEVAAARDADPRVSVFPEEEDVEMRFWASWPTTVLSDTVNRERFHYAAAMRPHMPLGYTEALAAYFGLPFESDEDLSVLLSVTVDGVFANISSGQPIAPFIRGQLPLWYKCAATYFYRLWGYDPNDAYRRAIGSYGHPLAMAALRALQGETAEPLSPAAAAFNPKGGSEWGGTAGPRLTFRGAHDWTIAGLYAALGLLTPAESLNPRFASRYAETVVLEAVTTAGGERRVRGFYGYPQQEFRNATEGALPSMPLQPMPLPCGDGAGCSMEAFEDLLRTTGPGVASPRCYATEEMLARCRPSTPRWERRCRFFAERCGRIRGFETAAEQQAKARRGWAPLGPQLVPVFLFGLCFAWMANRRRHAAKERKSQ